MRLEIQGRIVEVGDEFAKLSPEDQQRTVNEIAASFAKPQAPEKVANPLQGGPLEGPSAAYGLSTANSLLFGVPELVARGLGYGPQIEAIRQEYPTATTAGDITGLISPATIGAKLMSRGMSALGSRFGGKAAGTAEDTMRVLRQTEDEARAAADAARAAAPQPGVLERTTRTAIRQAPNVIGSTMGAQTGAGFLGGARSEGGYGAGFQQGAQTFGTAATNMPLTQMIPGAQQTLGAVTSIVPGVQGASSLGLDYLATRYMDVKARTREDQIREEAWKRAMRGPQ